MPSWWWQIFLTGRSVQRAFLVPVFLGVVMVKAPLQGGDLSRASKPPAQISSSQVTYPPKTTQLVGDSAEHAVTSKGLSFHIPFVTLCSQCPPTSDPKSIPGEELDFSYKWCLTVNSEGLTRHFSLVMFSKTLFLSQGKPT